MYLGEWGEISSKQGWERQIRLIWPESGDIAAFADSEVKILPFSGVLLGDADSKKTHIVTNDLTPRAQLSGLGIAQLLRLHSVGSFASG